MAFCLLASTAYAQLVDVVTGLDFPYGLALDGNDLYISQALANKISKIDISLPNPPIVDVATVSVPLALFLDGDELYFSEELSGIIGKINISQPNPMPTVVVTGLQTPTGLLKMGNILYITDQSTSILYYTDLSLPNPSPVQLLAGFNIPTAMVFKDSVLYVAEFGGARISSVDLKQTPLVRNTFVSGIASPVGMTLNGNFLYIAGASQVVKVDINQPNPSATVVVGGLSSARQVAFDGIDMYIAQVGGGQAGQGKISKLEIAQPVFSALGTICANALPANLGGASPTGGTYSGPGVTDNGDGETFSFNPAAAGGAGTYTITYTATNGNTATLTVAEAPVVSWSGGTLAPLDLGTVPLAVGSPAGGTYSGSGVLLGNMFNTYLAGVGMHPLTYTYTAANGCSGSVTIIVTVTPGANDACGGATSIDNLLGGSLNVPQVSTEFNNTGYTTAGDPSTGYDCFVDQGGPSLEHTLWYTFTGDGSKYRIRSVNCNNATPYNDDTQVAIYAGACNSLSPVACNDDENGAAQVYNISVEVATQAGTAYRMLVDGYDGKEGRFCLEVTRLGLSAVVDISQTNIQVFPNPTEGEIQLRNVTAEMVEVFDNMGRLVLSEVNPGSNLDISQTAAGIYFLKIYAGGQVYSTKVVKQ